MEESNSLYQAYLSMVSGETSEVTEEKKELDREKRNKMFRRAGNLSREALQGGDKGTEAHKKSGKIVKALNKDNEGKDRNDVTKEELDIYDTVLEYLLSDVVDTEESAVAIMPHLSEGYIESILEADSLAAMAARREKRLQAQRKKMGKTGAGYDFGHDYGLTADERKKRQQDEFDAFMGKKKKKS